MDRGFSCLQRARTIGPAPEKPARAGGCGISLGRRGRTIRYAHTVRGGCRSGGDAAPGRINLVTGSALNAEQPHRTAEHHAPGAAAPPGGSVPMPDLTGDLPCIGCGYNLKGLSIRELCPECGTAVRASILACVDPMADELRPLRRPTVVAYGMIVWAWAAVAAAATVWTERLDDALNLWVPLHLDTGRVLDAGLLFIALSGLASLVLIHPYRNKNGWGSFKAAGAVLLYLPLCYVHFKIHGEYDRIVGVPFLGSEGLDVGRSMLRLAENVLIVIIILGLRDNAVSLAQRSIVMRTGRVDTQPMTALVSALVLASVGDVLRLVFPSVGGVTGDLLTTFEQVVIAVGSFLFTLGLVGVGVDTLRLRRVLMNPAPGLVDIMDESHAGRS